MTALESHQSAPNGPAHRLSLSVIMPAHNEERTIVNAVEDILDLELGYPFELIVVDDGSTDATPDLLRRITDPRVSVSRHRTNQGKGAAVFTGTKLASGSHMVVFDADSEYRAKDLAAMFRPIEEGIAQVVFGARMFGANTLYPSFTFAIGNRLTTFAANVLFNSYLTDLHTCLKMLPVDLFRSLQLSHSGFGLDSEITAELLRRGYRPYEVPVSYVGRTRAQGKKITWQDGVACLKVLASVRLRGLVHGDSPAAQGQGKQLSSVAGSEDEAMCRKKHPSVAALQGCSHCGPQVPRGIVNLHRGDPESLIA